MLSLKLILFPVDFSPRSEQMAPYVAEVARKFQSEVRLLHISYAVEAGRERLANFACRVFDGVPVVRILEKGLPAERIAAYARYCGIPVIMMPTRGFGQFRKSVLGSTTEKLLHETDFAIWTTAHAEEPIALASPRRIVCGIDFSSRDVCVIHAASELACAYFASIRLIHVIASSDEASVDAARQRMESIQKNAGTCWEMSLETGPVAAGIRKGALDYAADLVVVGRGQVREGPAGNSSNIGKIVLDSPCPVLSV